MPDVFKSAFRRHHNLLHAEGVPPITGPVNKGKGKGNTAGKGHGKPQGGGGGSSVDYAYAENLAQVDVAHDAGFGDVATLTFTPEAADYVIISQTDCAPVPTAPAVARFRDGGSTMSDVRTYSLETTPPDKLSLSSLNVITGDGSTERTFKIQGDNEALSSVASFRQSRISALKLGENDEYVQTAAQLDIALNTFQAVQTLSFDAGPDPVDYYIIFHVKVSGSGTVAGIVELSDGTTTRLPSCRHGNADANFESIIAVTKLTGVSGAQTCTIRGRNASGTAIVNFKDRTILAMRADRFANSYFSGVVNGTDGTNTTYTTSISQTFTPAAAPHLTLIEASFHSGSTTLSSYLQALDDAEVLSEVVVESSSLNTFMVGHQIETYAASSRTQAIQRKSESTNTTTVGHGSILCLSLAGMTNG